MTCTTIGKEIVRGTICRDRWNITVLIHHRGPVPLNQLSHLWLSIDWNPDTGDRNVVLVLRSQTSTGGQIRFNAAAGPDRRTFSGDGQQLVALYGTRASTGSEGSEPDVFLDVVVDEEVRESVGLRVQAQAQPDVETGLDQLQAELAIAAQGRHPTDAAQQRVWDRYAQLFSDARTLADALGEVPEATIPTVAGALTPQNFELDAIKNALRSHGQPDSLATTAALGRTDAFDPFRGHWRGHWRQGSDCNTPISLCQDHQWGDTVPLPTQPQLYVQRVRLGDDSRPYREGSAACTALTDSARDVTLPAINLINIETGVIVGAVGVRRRPDAAGIVAQRPHVGFYIAPGRLLWVAEESLSDDGNEVTYSVFSESREGDPVDQPLYTIQGFELRWHRGRGAIVGAVTTKAGQYLKIMTAEERELERQFRDRALQPAHLEQPYYRRQLERLSPDDAEAFLNNAAEGSAIRDYLERLFEFVNQQAALAAAPTGPRPAITFIMGEEPDNVQEQFYNSAREFFTINPAGGLITDLRTLVEVRNYLANHAPSDSPWGEVNIIVHANEEGGMSIPVAVGGNQINPDLLRIAIEGNNIHPLNDAQIDVRTIIRIRGCSLGQNRDILELLSTAFGGHEFQQPVVRAPRHLQSYAWVWTGTLANVSEVEEHPVEFWFVGWPGAPGARPSRPNLVQRFQEKYPAVDIDWDRALRRQIPTIEEKTRDRSLSYGENNQFSVNLSPGQVPQLDNPAQRLAWLRSNTSFEEDLNGGGEQIDDYAWNITSQQAPLPEGGTRVTFTLNNQRTTLRLERDLRAQLSEVLFTLNSSLQTDLSNRTVSPALRTAFVNAGFPLSAIAQILIREVGQQWLILDPAHLLLNQPDKIKTFLIRRTDTNLSVRREDDLSTGAVVRAHPPVTDLRHFGEYVPARPATHPLGDNVPVNP